MTPEQRWRQARDACKIKHGGSVECPCYSCAAATIGAAIAEGRERILALEAALRKVLDEIGPCDKQHWHGGMSHDLMDGPPACPFPEARKVLGASK